MVHGRSRLRILFISILVSLCVSSLSFAANTDAKPTLQTTDKDWPMLGHDLARSNATPNQVDPPFGTRRAEAVWVRDFASGDETTSELVFNQSQPIVVGKLVYVGTSRNNIYALDTETGAIVWVYNGDKPGMVMASPAVVDGVLYYAATNGHVYALNAQTGQLLWNAETVRLGGFRTSPAVYNGTIYLGAEDGIFYALNTASGTVRWTYDTNAPILNTAAIDVNVGRIYFANEELYGFALNLNGELIWKSAKLHGISTRRFYPVIVGGGETVLFRTSPGSAHRALDGGDTLMGRTAGLTVPDDFTHLNHGDHGTNVYAIPGAGDVDREQTAIVNWLTHEHPEYETFYALNANNGSQRYIAPVLWNGGSGQVGEPPVAAPDGTVYVRARSYWGNIDFDNSVYHFGTPARLNLSTGRPTLLTLPEQNNSFVSGIFMIGDESSAMSLGGNRLYFYSHGDVIGSVLTSGADASAVTLSRDAPHTISNEERNPALPFGQDALAQVRFKGGAGGGSSLFGQPPVIADDKVFYISQGMIGMYKSGFSGQTNYIADSRGSQPSTGPISIPPASALESYVTEIERHAAYLSKVPDIHAELETLVADFISGDRYQPFIQLNGKVPGVVFFHDPTEEAYILALAYPYLSSDLQSQVNSHLKELWAAYPDPLNATIAYNDLTGRRRERYEIDNDAGQYATGFSRQVASRYAIDASERLYHLWGYAYYLNNWDVVLTRWTSISTAAHSIDPSVIESGSFPNRSVNRRVAALIGYTRITDHLRVAYPDNPTYQTEYDWAIDAATTALRARLQWEQDHRPTGSPWSRNWIQEGGGTDVFLETGWSTGGQTARYNGLVPAIARVLRDFAWDDMVLQDAFMDTVIPAQHLAWSFIPNRGETFSNLPSQSREAFLAKALIMGLDGEALRDYLSFPWCHGDLYYIERLVYLIRTLDAPSASKNASPTVPEYGEVLTYNISVIGMGLPITVTDVLPAGVIYVPHSARAEPDIGTLTDTGAEIHWTGTLAENEELNISFQVTVDVTEPQAIVNTAVIADAIAAQECSATVIANGLKAYLPLILKDWP